MRAEETEYLKAILACEHDLDRWRVRAQQLEVPERGSELESDDRVFPYHRISEVARTSLMVAGENLRLALDAIHRRNLYPSGHFGVLRSALVGACQAVWILAPDLPSDRQDRGLSVIDESYRQSRRFHEVTRTTAPDLTSADLQALDDQLSWIDGRRHQVSAVRPARTRLNLSDDVIPRAAAVVYADNARRSQVQLLWMQMSCDSHVLGWSLFQRSVLGPESKLTGLAEATTGGSLEDLAQPFVASYEILKRGWSLYDRRCEG